MYYEPTRREIRKRTGNPGNSQQKREKNHGDQTTDHIKIRVKSGGERRSPYHQQRPFLGIEHERNFFFQGKHERNFNREISDQVYLLFGWKMEPKEVGLSLRFIQKRGSGGRAGPGSYAVRVVRKCLAVVL